MSASSGSERGDTLTYLIGYVVALAMTGAAFAVVKWPSFASGTTLGIVLALGVAQMIVHFRCFLHITLAKSSRDDLRLILFSTLIVVLMVSGTLVVLMNQRARMM